ncbi:MAG: glycosyltransferase family 4 protein [Bacteroidota bacterium]|nr:glycosyltransferase family 4 protein [Bacteroidota bacterium]
MNILFVANRLPYPPFRGDKLKIYNLAKQLSNKHDLYLVTFIQDKKDYRYIKNLGKYFKEIEVVYLSKFQSVINCLINIFSSRPFQINYFRSSALEKLLYDFISKHNIDVIHTQHLRMSQYTYKINNIPTILDLPDAYSLYWKRRSMLSGSYLKKKFGLLEHKRVLNYENIIKNFDLTLVCSEEDKLLLMNDHQYNDIKILPNGIDLSVFNSGGHDYQINNRLIFTGNMEYFPNSDAAIYFSKEILPEILKKYPEVKFYIVGQNPPKKVMELQSDNIIITGFVKSMADEYRASSIAVSPVRVGAGTLNKVLEPMAMGLPVVSSPIGFEGIGAMHGEEIILAKDKKEFVNSIINLLADQSFRQYIGEGGKNLVTRNFGWNAVSEKLEDYFYQICSKDKNFQRESLQKAV